MEQGQSQNLAFFREEKKSVRRICWPGSDGLHIEKEVLTVISSNGFSLTGSVYDHGKYTVYNKEGTVVIQGVKEMNKNVGLWKTFYKDSSLKEKAFLVEDLIESENVEFEYE